MENTQEELQSHLMQTDDEFRRLSQEHHQYHDQLEALEQKQPFSEQDELEEQRLKKLKLHAKDQMNAILSRHKTAQVH